MAEDMPLSTAEHLWIDWVSYHEAIEELALLIHASGWKFDQILCLARGGLRPGDTLSRIFNVPLAILSTSSYVESNGMLQGGMLQGELSIGSAVTLARGKLHGRILLVDDLVDSGITLQKVQQYLARSQPDVTEVKSAVIWHKHCSVMRPDYCLHSLPENPWIHQPFEQYDSLRPEQLSAWANKGKR